MKSHVLLFSVLLEFVSQLQGAITSTQYISSCSDCPAVGRISPNEKTSNYNPRLRFSCKANYPIDWIFHYDEDDQVEIQSRFLDYTRNVGDFRSFSTYNYHIDVTVQYTQRLRLFPNFTCVSTENPTRLTRVVIIGNDDFFLRFLPDYSIRKLNSDCGAFISFALQGTRYEDSVGPCFRCHPTRNATRQVQGDKYLVSRKHTCHKPPLCESLWQYLQNSNKCMFTSVFNTDRACLITMESESYCFTGDERSCFTSGGLHPFVISCREVSESRVRGTQLGFYGVRNIGNLTIRPSPYFSWADVDKRDMIDFVQIKNDEMDITYVGQDVVFRCRISSYYCAQPIWISTTYEYQDPQYSKMKIAFRPLPNNFYNHTKTATTAGQEYYEALYKFKATAPGNINVSCHGPVFNDSTWIESTLTLEVREVEAPNIISLLQDKMNPSVIGEKNRSLQCEFRGHPISELIWQVNGKPVSNELTTVVTDWNKNRSTLWIHDVSKISGTHFTCSVTTFFATVEEKIDVKLIEQAIPKNYWIEVVIPLFICILIIFSLVTFHLWRKIHMLRSLTDDEINEFKLGNPNYSAPSDGNHDLNVSAQILPFDEKFQIPTKNVEIEYGCILGTGAFGMVYRGRLALEDEENALNYSNVDSILAVAVKTVKPDVEVEYFKALLSEVKVLGRVGNHDNIVRLLGACTEDIRDRKMFIILELCVNGSLESYLRNKDNRKIFHNIVEYGRIKFSEEIREVYSEGLFSTLTLFKWSLDIAKGLQHIHELNIIHGDLAIRNVLLSENFTAKISDFGLSRQLVNSANYVKKTQVPLPWRHMPPEALQERNFSKSSDVWAFGVTLWEIFELGHIPYSGNTYSHDFVNSVISGTRLTKPRFATNELYEYLLPCWELQPKDRTNVEDSFKVLVNAINQINQVKCA